MKTSVLVLTLIHLGLYNFLWAQQQYSLLKEGPYEEPVLASGVLQKFKTFMLNQDELQRLYHNHPDSIILSIPYGNQSSFECNLLRKNIFADRMQITTSSGEQQEWESGSHYRGKVTGDAGSYVAFSFFKDCLFGLIATDEGNFNLVFLRDEKKNPTGRYVLYNDRDLTIPNNFSCGIEELPKIQDTIKAPADVNITKAAVDCRTVRQYLECDFRMFQDNGSNVQNTINWTTGMFNVMSGIYDNEQVDIKISEIFVWNTQDHYPSSNAGNALKAFGNFRKDNFNGHIAHLLSTKNVGNGGLAWVNVLCKNYIPNLSYGRFAYSNINDSYQNLPLWSWTISAVTHETGHNLGSQHTHWCGWELSPGNFGPIDHCYPAEPYNGVQCYNGPAQAITGSIMSYCHISGNVNLNQGFGPLPGKEIRKRVSLSACLGPTAPTVTGKLQYCAGESINLTASFVGGQLQWQGPNNFTSSSGQITIPNANPTHAGEYAAKLVGSLCTASRTLQVDVSNKPEKPVIVGEQGGSLLSCHDYSPAYDYEWYNENDELQDITPQFSPTSSGRYYVIASNHGCQSDPSELYLSYNLMSMGEAAESTAYHIWPNPASENLSVQFQTPVNGDIFVSVYDMNGRLVYRKNVALQHTNTFRLDVAAWSDGMYVLEIRQPTQIHRMKFLVKN